MAETDYSLYIHIPFCRSKCSYCDFYSCSGNELKNSEIDLYIDQIIKQGQILKKYHGIDNWKSLYIGGGTPSFLNSAQFLKLSNLWKDSVIAETEITIEVNPESFTYEKMECYTENLVNRISVGIQSFDNKLLKKMDRPASLEQTEKALSLLSLNWEGRLSGDLIYGFPGTFNQQSLNDINRLEQEGINHLSLYQLTLEEGTPLTQELSDKERKKLADYQNEIWPNILKLLNDKKYKRYEISNFTKGRPSYHNLRYWQLKGWIGLGPGASSFIPSPKGGVHYSYPRNFKRFLTERDFLWDKNSYNEEKSEGNDFLIESLMMGLRHSQGCDLKELEKMNLLTSALREELEKLIDDGFCFIQNQFLRPSHKGMDFHNSVMLRIMNAIDPGTH